MKIIKPGVLPGTTELKGECGHCKAVVQFAISEARCHTHRNETHYSVKCPTSKCPEAISVEDLPQNRVQQ
jgi:hypothetical protein